MKTKPAAEGKRWCPGIDTKLLAFVLTVPSLIVFLGARTGEQPVVGIERAMAGRDPNVASFHQRKTAHGDRLLGGLLVDGHDQKSCHSRYQSVVYRRNAGRQPSQYLVSKLRSQEALQRRCGPGTAAYTTALEQLKSGKSTASPECKYLVSISYRGLGNRILAAASAFMYALLTDRVLLVDPSHMMDELFCEPFPNTTWLLPPRFPLLNYQSFYLDTPERYGRMREDGVLGLGAGERNGSSAPAELPAFAYIHLDYNQTDHDKRFFCDDDQRVLRGIQWLVMRTDSYIVPGLFLVMAFQEELDALFPEPDTVFHHLGRYLFHPTNQVWGLIARYYRAHLASARRVVGIQVRVFPWEAESPEILEQIKTCTQNERLLPAVLDDDEPTTVLSGAKPTAVLVTSLKAWYSDKMKEMYWERATADGEVVVVDQPSHEETQRYNVRPHEHKAWAEVYLLSVADMLVTTGQSTFGYVAQGLGGLKPWVLHHVKNGTVGWPCSRDVSMEPCFHVPPVYDCKRREDAGLIVPHVRHCGDLPAGLKLVDRREW
ncbi:Galactoside 2-alpha-L-fucosyltransferase [Hordeum vulgare]|nr:Galactoside 2-alpha-L-fucosyltransferase [Hordeum vulgare]